MTKKDEVKYTMEDVDKHHEEWKEQMRNKELDEKNKRMIAESRGFTMNLPEMSELPDELKSRIKNTGIVVEDKPSTRRKIVDWDHMVHICLKAEIVNVAMLQDYIKENYNKELHYSEALRFLTKRKNTGVNIERVEVKTGSDKNVYYKFTSTILKKNPAKKKSTKKKASAKKK